MDKLEKALEKARALRQGALADEAPKTTAACSSSPQAGAQTASATACPATSRPSADLPRGADVQIPLSRLEQSRIVAHLTRSSEADIFRLLRTQCLRTMTERGVRTLAVTSPDYADGKTTVALNLAVSIAQDLKQTVLLVDLDLRKPCLASYLGIESKLGLTDYLEGRCALPDCLIRLPFERLSLLPAGRALDRSSEVLGSPQMAALASELKNRYPDRVILYDMPPLLLQDDPLAFLPHTDGVLLVLQEGKTGEEDVRRSLDILQNATLLGTVLNARRL